MPARAYAIVFTNYRDPLDLDYLFWVAKKEFCCSSLLFTKLENQYPKVSAIRPLLNKWPGAKRTLCKAE